MKYRLQDCSQLCFIHIPKTAGTTLTSILESRFDRHEICPTHFWTELKEIPDDKLAQYRLFRGHFPFPGMSNRLPDHAHYITMLRDPIERVISAYEFMKTCTVRPSAHRSAIVQQKALTLSLKEFVQDPVVTTAVNAQTRQLAGRQARRKIRRKVNLDKLPLTDPEWLESAQENLDAFTFVGITEQFWESMALLSYSFGWPPLAEIQRLMVGSKRLRRESLTQDVVDVIVEKNQLDLELYHYGKTLFETRYTQMIQQIFEQDGHSIPSRPADADPEILYSLLDKHYQSCYAKINSEPQAAISFNFDRALPGAGWHRWEGRGGETSFRWTGPGTISTLDFGLTVEQDCFIELRVLNASAPDVLQSLSLLVNDQPIHLITLYRQDMTAIFRGLIPKAVFSAERPLTRITIQVNRTTTLPLESDKRQLGVAIDLVQIFPVATVPPVSTTDFLFDTQPWQDVVSFLTQHVQPGQQIFAPNVFRLKFPESVPGEEQIPAGQAANYSASRINTAHYQWAVIHKGMYNEIGPMLIQLIGSTFMPVFANEVFIVFSKQREIPKLSYTSPHVRFAYTGYIKSSIEQRINRLTSQIQNSAMAIARRIAKSREVKYVFMMARQSIKSQQQEE